MKKLSAEQFPSITTPVTPGSGFLSMYAKGVKVATLNSSAKEQLLVSESLLTSRTPNVITNGAGDLGDNTNFSGSTYTRVEVPPGAAGSFYYTGTYPGAIQSDEFISVDPAQQYILSVAAMAGNSNGSNYDTANRQYAGFAPYNIDSQNIFPQEYSSTNNDGSTFTTLTVALTAGATTVTVASTSGWSLGGASAQLIALGSYTTVNGYVFPAYTYTQNTLGYTGYTGNVITLISTYFGATLPIGTKVWNSYASGTFKYNVLAYTQVLNAWATYTGRVGGISNDPNNQSSLPSATAFIRTLFLPNYVGGATATIRYANISLTRLPGVTAADVGLGNVNNTSDVNKPVSTAQQTALNLKANLISSTLVTPTLGVASATSVAITGTTGAGLVNLIAQSAAPTTPTAGTINLYSATTNGFTRTLQQNEAPTNIVLGRDSVILVRNTTGAAITKAAVVYVTGSTGNVPNIAMAQANSSTTLPAIGVLVDSIAINAYGQCMLIGILSNFDTSAFATGVSVWVSSTVAGGLTSTRPTGVANFVQRIGTVLVSGVGNGSIKVAVSPSLFNSETGTNAPIWTGSSVVANSITLSGNISQAAWTTSGLRIKGITATLTDTTSTGTVAAAYTDSFGGNTIAATSVTTFTNYTTAFFKEPLAGTNITFTTKTALGAESLRVGNTTPLTVSTAGVLNANSPTFTGTVTLPAAQAVNGVTLSAAGGTGVFLRGDGTYAAATAGTLYGYVQTINLATYAGTNSLAQELFAIRFVASNNISIVKIYYYLIAKNATNPTIEVGIYSAAGSRLVQATDVPTTTGMQTVTVSSTNLVIGTVYYLAVLNRTSGDVTTTMPWAGNAGTDADLVRYSGGNATMPTTLAAGTSGRTYFVAASGTLY